jgi:hypothetical protein
VSIQVQDEAEDPSCLVALVLVEDPKVVVDSPCGYAAHQVGVGIDEEGPFVGFAECEAVLGDQRGMVCQGLHFVVVALFLLT